VYALGLLLFESLAGESPYGITDAEPLPWMYAHVEKRPRRLRELCPQAPEPLDGLVARMLDKLPTQRPSVVDVEAQLRALLTKPTRLVSWPTVKQAATMSFAGIALGGIIWSAYLVNTSPSVYRLLRRAAPSDTLWKTQGRLADAVAHTPNGMVLIPGQTFVMGSTTEAAEAALALCQRFYSGCAWIDFEREAKRRLVTVNLFYLDRHEVTNQEYVDFLNKPLRNLWVDTNHRIVSADNTAILDLHPTDGRIVLQNETYAVKLGAEKMPVVQVTWQGANLYCASLGRRLPTEAEWELAARGMHPDTDPTQWPWGATVPDCAKVTVARDKGGYCQHLASGPLAVEASPGDVTPHGVHDLGGNVREWVADRFAVPYPDCGECVDPLVSATSGNGPQYRVVRGGNWMQEPTTARSAWRSRFQENQISNALGFRCASPVQAAAEVQLPQRVSR